jgi:hypothetical protein
MGAGTTANTALLSRFAPQSAASTEMPSRLISKQKEWPQPIELRPRPREKLTNTTWLADRVPSSCRNVRFTPESEYRLVASRHLTNNAIERHSAPRSTRARQTKPCMNQHKTQSLCTKRVVTAFQIVRSQQGSVWIPHSGFSYTPC